MKEVSRMKGVGRMKGVSRMKGNRQTMAVVAVLLFGFILFFAGTDGFRAFTAEAARVNQLLKDRPHVPEVVLEDNFGRKYTFAEFENKYVFATFMYASCPTVCVRLEWNMADVYGRIPERYIGEDIIFLSISFDPERDDPAVLNRYRTYFGSDGETWRMARIPDPAELDALLKRLGVIVIPDEYGNFTHNTAFYLIDRDGGLLDVMDDTKPEEAALAVIGLLERKKEG